MATRKRGSKAKKGSKSKKGSSKARKSSRKTSARAASIPSGPVPPYGDPIRKAIARGDVQEMRQLSVSTRKWLDDVNAALADLESSIEKA